jgi:hypothetical protein
VLLQERPEPDDVRRIALDDRVRVSDDDRDELDPVHLLAPADRHVSEILLDLAARKDAGDDAAAPDAHANGRRARSVGEPGGGDPRPVSGELRLRAVRVPDEDLDGIDARGEHLEHAVRPACELPSPGSVEATVVGLDDDVCVTECVPLRGCHRRPLPGLDPRRS